MASSTAMTLSQQPGDVLKASSQLRRQVDSRDEYDGEVREHRHVGGLRWRGWAARRAACNRVEPQEQATEAYQDAEHEDRCQPRLAREGRAQHQKLAHEYAEWWKPRDGHHAEHEAPAQHRIGHCQPAHVGNLLRALDLRDVA